MKKLLYIKDKHPLGINLLMSLSEMLAELEPVGKKYEWSIKNIWATYKGELEGITWDEFEEIVENSRNGYCLSWEELKKFAANCNDVIDLVLVANDTHDFFSPTLEGREFLSRFPLSLALLDKDYWEVCTSDEGLIKHLLETFNDVEVIDVESLKK